MNGPRTEVGSGNPKLFSITPTESEDGEFGIQDSVKSNTAAFEKLYVPGKWEYFQNNWYTQDGSCTYDSSCFPHLPAHRSVEKRRPLQDTGDSAH